MWLERHAKCSRVESCAFTRSVVAPVFSRSSINSSALPNYTVLCNILCPLLSYKFFSSTSFNERNFVAAAVSYYSIASHSGSCMRSTSASNPPLSPSISTIFVSSPSLFFAELSVIFLNDDENGLSSARGSSFLRFLRCSWAC